MSQDTPGHYTDAALGVIQRTHQHAARMEQTDRTHTGHMLLALIDEPDGWAARVLQGFGIGRGTAYELEQNVFEMTPPAPPEPHDVSASELQFTWDMAELLALRLGRTQVDTGHLLASLYYYYDRVHDMVLFESGSDRVGAQVLRRVGVHPENLRRALLPEMVRRIPKRPAKTKP